MATLTVSGLSKSYGGREVVAGVSFARIDELEATREGGNRRWTPTG